VTRRLADGSTVHWGQLAAELGYADQAHLTRDFTAMFGESPGHYARRYS
jgi:AraC-like DNA-binding protein